MVTVSISITLPCDTASIEGAGHEGHFEAIAEKTEAAQPRADFDAAAEERYASLVSSGKTIPWPEMRRYMEARLKGKAAKRPPARTLAR